MTLSKQDKLMRKIENHLRITARQLLKFDTEEEVLQYLADSFQSRLGSDFVGVIVLEGDYIFPKVWSGHFFSFKEFFPILMERCTPHLFKHSLTFEDKLFNETCEFIKLLSRESVKTWFTVPIHVEQQIYGFCVIGYFATVTLLEMDETFDEFGEDISIALSVIKRMEQEQKKRMSIEFISKNLLLNESIENLVAKIVEQAGKGTNATFAGIYLYDEKQNHFKFQPPSYGMLWKPEKLVLKNNYILKEYFPYLETPGGTELSVPLMLDIKIFGVLHVEKKQNGIFTREDLEMLAVMAEHVSTMLRNTYLYNKEREQMKRLHSLLGFQQNLIKKTVTEDGFDGITNAVSEMLDKPVLLLDRFFRLISYHLLRMENIDLDPAGLKTEVNKVENCSNGWRLCLSIDGKKQAFLVWPVNGGRDIVGYLLIEDNSNNVLDAFDQLAIDLIRNIYSVQFIKQKLVMDTKAQVKDTLIDLLLVEKVEEVDTIMQYANLFNWNAFATHRVSVLSIHLDETEKSLHDIFSIQTLKSTVFDYLKMKFSNFDEDILFAKKGDIYMIIVPETKELLDKKKYWKQLMKNIQKWLSEGKVACYGLLGIGGKASKLENYYKCYKQALQTLHLVIHQEIAGQYAFFEDLGSYTLLHLIKDTSEAHYFMRNYLEKLLEHSKGNNINLFETLRMYLEQNGNIKKTSDHLFIHRSTLLYRLEKIKDILQLDIDDFETRFNLMMTYKLFDLQQKKLPN